MGSYFGEVALMDTQCERTATVTALSYCELYSLDKENYEKVCLW